MPRLVINTKFSMFESSVYKTRREALCSKVHSGLILLLGNEEVGMNYAANVYEYRQDSTFLYYMGHPLPGLAAVIDVESNETCLYGNDLSIDDIVWTGPQPTINELALKVEAQRSASWSRLSEEIHSAIAAGRKIHFLPQYRYRNQTVIEDLLGIRRALQSEHASLELIRAVVEMRAVKEPREIEEIEKACAIGQEMQLTVMRLAKPGGTEKHLAAQVDAVAFSLGSKTAFPTILSQHGETLHNPYHDGILQEGKLLLTDCGAETVRNYCSDYSRTIPVSGKYSSRQREIYEIVYASYRKALELARPGITYMQVHLEACKVIFEGVKALGLAKGDTEEAVKAGAHALFFPCGLGHMMGMDVHDMENLGQNNVGYDEEVSALGQFGIKSLRMGRRLQPGFVMTDEPGIYFIPQLIDRWRAEGVHRDFLCFDAIEKYKDFGGIRIEDDILITEEGSRFLGGHLVNTADEIENLMASAK